MNKLTYNTIPVITFEMVAKVHGRPVETIRSAHKANRSYFKEGIHQFRLNFSTASELVGIQPVSRNGLTVLTKKGYLLLVKALNDETAWRVQERMIDEYFDLLEEKTTHFSILAPHRLSRDCEHVVTMPDGNHITTHIKIPQAIWDVSSAAAGGRRLSGPMIHELTYPWAEAAAKAEYRRRKLTGDAGGRKGDTFGQHLILEIFYSGTYEMLGVMKAALAQILEREKLFPLSDDTRFAMFKELTRNTVHTVGIVVSLINNASLALYPDGKQELLQHPQLSLFQAS